MHFSSHFGHHHSHDWTLDDLLHRDDHIRYVYLMRPVGRGGSEVLGLLLLIKFISIAAMASIAAIAVLIETVTDRRSGAGPESASRVVKDGSYSHESGRHETGSTDRRKQGRSPGMDRRIPTDGARSASQSGKSETVEKRTSVAERFAARTNQLATAIIAAAPTKREELIESYRMSKGGEYTEALAIAAAKLTGDWQARVREALAQRLTRMTASTLDEFLGDRNREVRRAAALACGAKKDKAHVHKLIGLLAESDGLIVQAARAALKAITALDYGPQPGAVPSERLHAVVTWRVWEQNQLREASEGP